MKRILLGSVLLAGLAEGATCVTNATSAAFGFCPSAASVTMADSPVFGFVASGLSAAGAASSAFGYVGAGQCAAESSSLDFGYVASGQVAAQAASLAFGYVLPGGCVAADASATFGYALPGTALVATPSVSFGYMAAGCAVASSESAAYGFYPAGAVLSSASSEPFEFGETVPAAIKASIAWKFDLLTGCCTAQLKLTCTNGFETGISNLRFLYQDRCVGYVIKSALWNSSTGTYRPTVDIDGTAYRYVDLDASKIGGADATAVYGVQKIPPSVGFVPTDQRLIEIRTFTPYDLISDIGYVTWESGGQSRAIPVSAADGVQDRIVRDLRKALKIVADMVFQKPLSQADLNLALAVGVPMEEGEEPFCDM